MKLHISDEFVGDFTVNYVLSESFDILVIMQLPTGLQMNLTVLDSMS